MTLLFYLTFIYLIIITIYYFLILKNITYDNLFVIILNFIFLIILPLYYAYFKDNLYSFIISVLLCISAFFYNLKIKEVFRLNKILPIIYFLITCFILSYMISIFIN